MSESMNYKEFRDNFEFARKGRGLKVVEKAGANKKRHKYAAEKTEVDGIVFDSKAEAKCYTKLKMMELAKVIKNLKVNAALKGADKIRYTLLETPFKMWYEPDFEFDYVDSGIHVVADKKGFKTKEYRKKKKLMKEIHGIEIQEF